MSDAVLKIGAIVDKDAIASGMAENAGAVDKSTVAMGTSFTELQGRATKAWKQIADDTRAASASVSGDSLKAAESAKALADAQREVAAAARLGRIASVDQAEALKVQAAAQDKVRAATLANREAQSALLPVIEKVDHATVSGVQATSAAIRTLEGNAGLRAVENFLAKTLGLGPALQAVFPIIGGLAFGKILFDIGEKVYEIGVKAAGAAVAIGGAFEVMHDKALITNDDLRITSDHLADQIAKLSDHPGDGLQTALDEAIKRADQLLVSLRADQKEIGEIFKANSVGALGEVLSGVSGTGKQEKELNKDNQSLIKAVADANTKYSTELANSKTPEAQKAAGERHAQAIRESFQKPIDAYQREIGRLQKQQNDAEMLTSRGVRGAQSVDNSAKIANLKGVIDNLQGRLSGFSIGETISGQQQQVGKLKQDKENGGDDKEAERRYKAMEAHVAEWRTLAPVSQKMLYDYWEVQKSTFAVGSQQYNSILEKQATLAAEGATKVHEAIAKVNAGQARLADEGSKANLAMMSQSAGAMGVTALNDFFQAGAKWDGYWKEVAHGREIQAQVTAQLQESQIKANLLAGTISPLAAAQQFAAIHTREHAASIAALAAELKRLEDAAPKDAITGNVVDPKQAAQIEQVKNQIAQARGAGARVAQGDQAAIATDFAAPYLRAAKTITSSFTQVTDQILRGQKSITQGARMMAGEMAMSVIHSVEQQGEKWIAHEIMLVALRHVANGQKVASDAVSATASAAAAVGANVAAATSAAGLAGANAVAATAIIPFVGPELAPAAGAAAMGVADGFAALAAFERGGIVSGSPGMAVPILAHSGERVLTVQQTSSFERMVNNTNNGGSPTNITFAGNHSYSGGAGGQGDWRGGLKQHRMELARELRSLRREGHI